ncbi:MAG: MlaD family protein [Dokdonella sp.]
MTENEKASELVDEIADLPVPVVRQRSRFAVSLIWLVPAIAALIGLSLVVGKWLKVGPVITISFQTAEGIEANKTPVKYKNVVIGKVTAIRLSEDRSTIVAEVDLDKGATSFATTDTRYWVVRPRVGLGGISGVDTLISGAFIGADVGESTDYREDFVGLETPPPVTHGAPGKRFILHTADLGSLDIGSPVYYRRIQVGRVVAYELDKDGKNVSLQVFIDAPHDRYVSDATRFWNASGVDVSLGANGLQINSQSLATVLAGGVAFQTPTYAASSSPVAEENSQFTLYDDMPMAMAPPDGEPQYLQMRFQQSMRGLAVDAPVEFLGVAIGRVLSVKLDYDEKTQRFPVEVSAVVYPRRLGAAYDKLVAMAQRDDGDSSAAHLLGKLVANGLRAQARSGNLLTGQMYVALDFIPNAKKVEFDVAAEPLQVPTVPGSFDKLQEQLAEIVEKVNGIPLDQIGKNLNNSLAGLDKTIQRVNGEVLPSLKGTLDGAKTTLGSVNGVVGGDSRVLNDLSQTLREVQRMARSLRVFGDYLDRHPEALIRGRNDPPAPAATPPAKENP